MGSQKDRALKLLVEASLPEPESPLLEGERLQKFQSLAALFDDLALDRPDLQFAAKELMRKMSAPAEADEGKLKRAGRYLRGWLRLIVVHMDSDFAGCAATWESTSGGAVVRGAVCLKRWAKTRPTVALSPGEAELAAVARGAAEGFSMLSALADFGVEAGLHARSDAAAAIGVVGREGVGKVRHLATADLWVQQHVRRG